MAVEGIQEISVLSAQFFCKLKTALKKYILMYVYLKVSSYMSNLSLT